MHYNWCIKGKNVQTTPGHLAAREKALQEFVIKKGNKDAAARRYATEAVRQYQQSQAMATGFKPPVWSDDFNSHYRWSQHGNNIATTPTHLATREKELQEFAIRHNKKPVIIDGTAMKVLKAKHAIILPKETPQSTAIIATPDSNKGAIETASLKAFQGKIKALVSTRPRPSPTAAAYGRLLPIAASPAAPENPIFDVPVNAKVKKVDIGIGYNSLLGQLRAPAIYEIPPNKIKRHHTGYSTTFADYIREAEDIEKYLGVDVNVSGSYLFVSGSSNNSYMRDASVNKFNETYFVNALTETFNEYSSSYDFKLTPEAKRILKEQGINAFYQRYGDSFVYAVQHGAGLQATASYKLYKSGEHVKFASSNQAGAGFPLWQAKVGVKVEKEEREKRERETLNVKQNKFGFEAKNPITVKQLQDLFRNFGTLPGAYAEKSNDKDSYSGVLYYTVVKYDFLPDFQQLTGGPNKMNTKAARRLLDKLFYYQRKFQRIKNNLIYINEHPRQFKKTDVNKAKEKIGQLNNYLQDVNSDIYQVAWNPFDNGTINNVDRNLSKYAKVPAHALDYTLVRVVIDFPLLAENESQEAHIGKFIDHTGPLFGYDIIQGDGDVYGDDGAIDIAAKSKLLIKDSGREAWLWFHFREHENRGDHTVIEGEKELKVYQAPEGYKIVGFKNDYTEYRFNNLRNGSINAIKDVKEKEGDLWKDMHIVFDSPEWDHPHVGAYGTMVIYVKIKEL